MKLLVTRIQAQNFRSLTVVDLRHGYVSRYSWSPKSATTRRLPPRART